MPPRLAARPADQPADMPAAPARAAHQQQQQPSDYSAASPGRSRSRLPLAAAWAASARLLLSGATPDPASRLNMPADEAPGGAPTSTMDDAAVLAAAVFAGSNGTAAAVNDSTSSVAAAAPLLSAFLPGGGGGNLSEHYFLLTWGNILLQQAAAYNASGGLMEANTTSFETSVGYMEVGANATAWGPPDDMMRLVTMVITAIVLAILILATIIGNVFVIAAILLERHLQNVANYLILSLAVADLLVAGLVMPLGAVYEVSQQWTLGPELCDMWTSSDVLCCTASILHLVAIALDRYWAVTNIDYIHQRTAKRIGIMILVVWSVAFLVCVAPMLGWKDPGWDARVALDLECMVSQDLAYQIFATASSFYVPLLVILVLYWRIFQTARSRIRRRVQAQTTVGGRAVPGAAGGSGGLAAAVVGMIGRPLPTISETTTTTTTTAFTNVSSNNTSPEKTSFANGLEVDPPTMDQMSCGPGAYPASSHHHHHYPAKRKSKEAMDSKRERKAAKTLAIITGAFVMCWLPFFIMAILQPVCQTCYFNKYMVSFFLWLGYFNSTLNPIIYTIFSPEFRHAFKRLLCGRKATLRRRNRHLAARGLRHL